VIIPAGTKRKRNTTISYNPKKIPKIMTDKIEKQYRKRYDKRYKYQPITTEQAIESYNKLLKINEKDIITGTNNDPNNDIKLINDGQQIFRLAYQNCNTGDIYEGYWMNNKRHGKGICLYGDGLMYEGNWSKGKEHGKGYLMTGNRKVIYNGDWYDGYIHGHGKYRYSNGDIYIGDWREGNRHGRGDYIFKNGTRYSGDWKDNKRQGKGNFIWANKSYYSGEWDSDKRYKYLLLLF